jgi:hypothetical protein
MSKEDDAFRATISNAGRYSEDLEITGYDATETTTATLHIHQCGAARGALDLSLFDAYRLTFGLVNWIKRTTEKQAKVLEEKIKKDERLKNTIFEDAVACQRFIDELGMLEVPIRMLGNSESCAKPSDEQQS